MGDSQIDQQGVSSGRASNNELLFTALQGCGCTVDLVWCSACANVLARKSREGGPLTPDPKQGHVDFTAAMFRGLKDALQADPEYAWSWQCNVAMCAVDEGVDAMVANNAAARFMKLCFDVDIKKSPQWASLCGDSVLSATEID